MKTQGVLLVEFGESHEECLASQILFLKAAEIPVFLAVHKNAESKIQHYKELCKGVFLFDVQKSFANHRKISKVLNTLCKNNNIGTVVFNTAQGTFVRNFCLLNLFNKKKFLGIIHTIKKLEDGSFTQKIISLKIKKYYLISDILYNKLSPKNKRKVEVFYPLFFYPRKPEKFPEEVFNIVIPGGVETRRKDLKGFLKHMKDKPVSEHWRIIFAGKTDRASKEYSELFETLPEALKSKCKLFHDFIDEVSFQKIISESHLLLPLIHPGTPSNDEYMTRQISGTFNLAYGYQKPMLIHKAFQSYEELVVSSFFYEEDTLFDLLVDLDKNRTKITEKSTAITAYPKFAFEYQKDSYIDHLNR